MAVTYRRADTFSIRIDARTRFALDLLSRSQRVSVTQIIHREIQKALADNMPTVRNNGHETPLVDAVWDVFLPDRMVKLALYAPDLLTEDEQRVWRVISEDPKLLPKKVEPNFKAIRDQWKQIQQKVREYEKASGD